MGKNVFLSYAREDLAIVETIYYRLEKEGFKPWMDVKNIRGGQLWEPAIKKAIRQSDYILVCLSDKSVNKRGYLQKEIREALDIWEEKLEDDIYLIPIRMEDCQVHPLLRNFQWIDYYKDDGWIQLKTSLTQGVITSYKIFDKSEKSIKKEFISNEEKFSTNLNAEILIVEDYKHSQIVIQRILAKNHFNNLMFAENGLEAIEKANTKVFNLVLMDMQMPIMNGFEAIPILRKMSNYSDVPIVGLTAFAMKGDVAAILMAGANDVLAKPIDSQELVKKINYYLSNNLERTFFPKLILIGEKDKTGSRNLENSLWVSGYKNIVTIKNSAELLKSIIKNRYEVIILHQDILNDSNLPLIEIIQRLVNYQVMIIVVVDNDLTLTQAERISYANENIIFEMNNPAKVINRLKSILRSKSI